MAPLFAMRPQEGETMETRDLSPETIANTHDKELGRLCYDLATLSCPHDDDVGSRVVCLRTIESPLLEHMQSRVLVALNLLHSGGDSIRPSVTLKTLDGDCFHVLDESLGVGWFRIKGSTITELAGWLMMVYGAIDRVCRTDTQEHLDHPMRARPVKMRSESDCLY